MCLKTPRVDAVAIRLLQPHLLDERAAAVFPVHHRDLKLILQGQSFSFYMKTEKNKTNELAV